MTSPIDAKRLEELWRYSINYGPDGEANYANVFTPDGILVGNLRTHHAVAIVEQMNAATALASLKAENERLREVIRPFAEAARSFDVAIGPDGIDDGLTVIASIHVMPEREARLGTQHFSADRASLTAQEDKS